MTSRSPIRLGDSGVRLEYVNERKEGDGLFLAYTGTARVGIQDFLSEMVSEGKPG